jgi:hypothetical protein
LVDFRSTFRTWAAERTNFPREAIEAALAPIGNKVEAAYQRGDLFEKRGRLMDAWTQFCSLGGAVGAASARMAYAMSAKFLLHWGTALSYRSTKPWCFRIRRYACQILVNRRSLLAPPVTQSDVSNARYGAPQILAFLLTAYLGRRQRRR